MASILDDLKGILTPEEFAKVQGRQDLATRLTRGDELRSFYDGEETTPPASVTPPASTTPPPAAGQFDLGVIERMLDTKIGKINETVDARVAEVVKTRGDELVNNAVKISIQRADELNRIYGRHERETGKAFDSADFNAFLEKPENKARGFRTITEAYEAYSAPQAMEREVDRRFKAKVAADSGQHVPGTTPAPATNSNIRVFMKRGANGSDAPTTGAGKAAAALDKIMSRRMEMAS